MKHVFCKIGLYCASRQDTTIKLKEAIRNLNVVSIVNNAFCILFGLGGPLVFLYGK